MVTNGHMCSLVHANNHECAILLFHIPPFDGRCDRAPSGMVFAMLTSGLRLRPIDPRIIGLLRRSLVLAGLLSGFLLLGAALAHAQGNPPPQHPKHGVRAQDLGLPPVPGLPGLPSLPPVTQPITQTLQPVAGAVTSTVSTTVSTVANTTAPVTGALTHLTSGLTTTIAPIVQPVGITPPGLPPIPPPAVPPPPHRRPPPPAGIPVTAPDPTGSGASTSDPTPTTAATELTQLPSHPRVGTQFLVPQLNSVLVIASAGVVGEAATDGVLTDNDPALPPNSPFGQIADATGATGPGGGNAHGPAAGVSRPISGISRDLSSAIRVWPGAGPPEWWFFDPHHHPS